MHDTAKWTLIWFGYLEHVKNLCPRSLYLGLASLLEQGFSAQRSLNGHRAGFTTLKSVVGKKKKEEEKKKYKKKKWDKELKKMEKNTSVGCKIWQWGNVEKL